MTAARPSLAEYCATYIRAVENAGKAKKTVALYQGVLRHLTGWVTRKCADQSCDVLTHETLDGFVAWLKNDFVSLRGNHLGDYSLHQYVNIVKIAASWGARGKRYWPVSPLAEYRAPAYIEKEPEYFEEDEVRKLFAACGTPITWTGRRLRAMFLVSLDTGMRRGELVKLTLPMVDLESGRIRLSAADGWTKMRRHWAPCAGLGRKTWMPGGHTFMPRTAAGVHRLGSGRFRPRNLRGCRMGLLERALPTRCLRATRTAVYAAAARRPFSA